jgi:hypothetical protein
MPVAAQRSPLVDHRVEIGLRLLRRDAVLQPADQIQEVTAPAVRKRRGVDREGQEDFDALVVDVVARRHDPDNARRDAVDRHDAAERPFVASEIALPRRIGNDADVFRADGGVGLAEEPAAQRRHPEHVEQLRRHDHGVHAARALRRTEIHGAGGVCADGLKRPVPLPELGPLGQRDPEAIEAQPRKRAGDELQPLRPGVRQRLEHDAVDDAEDGGVGADPERERQDGHRHVPGTPAQGPEGIPDVVRQGLHMAVLVNTTY